MKIEELNIWCVIGVRIPQHVSIVTKVQIEGYIILVGSFYMFDSSVTTVPNSSNIFFFLLFLVHFSYTNHFWYILGAQ